MEVKVRKCSNFMAPHSVWLFHLLLLFSDRRPSKASIQDAPVCLYSLYLICNDYDVQYYAPLTHTCIVTCSLVVIGTWGVG